MPDPVLTLKDITLSLAGNAGIVEILHGISLEVAPGERLGLVGPSGSGKSSLLMVMGGLERASSGEAHSLGHDLTAMDEDALACFRLGHMGVVFQSFNLIPTMTALENVATPLELAGDRAAFDKAAKMLESVGLAHRVDHYPAQMSGGEQQRVALARALAPEPDILLADEPTGNLDRNTSGQVFELMLELSRQHGTAFVVVTHDEQLAARCGRCLHMKQGVLMPAADTAPTA